MENNDTMIESLSTSNTTSSWDSIREEQQWDDFVAWCREQENCAHE